MTTDLQAIEDALKFIYDIADEEYSYQRSNVGAECALRHIINKSREAIRRMKDPPGVREGWVCVPREPTTKMLNAAIDTHPFELGDISGLGLRMSPQKLFSQCYKAMIDAAQNQ